MYVGLTDYGKIFVDAFPQDKRGNRDLIAICSMNIILYVLTYFFYRTLNAKRDQKWNSMNTKVRNSAILQCITL